MTPLRRPPIGLACLLLVAWQARGQTFTVNTTIDFPDIDPGDGVCETFLGGCSLRAAIQEVNELGTPGTPWRIHLNAGVYELRSAGVGGDTPAVGDLDINADVEIVSVGGWATIDAKGIDRVFEIRATATLSGLDITGGFAVNGGGILFVGGDNTLDLEDSIVRENFAQRGGGIYASASGNVVVRNTVVRDNEASIVGGGALFAGFPSSVDSTWTGNTAPTAAAMVCMNGSLFLLRSTVSGNPTATSSVLMGPDGNFSAYSSTFVEPTSIAIELAPNTRGWFKNSLISGTCANDSEDFEDLGGNLESPGSTCELDPFASAVQVPDAALRTLAYYGGPTPTHALLSSSPARDVSVDCDDNVDQRAAPRSSPLCDAGAFEFGAQSPLSGIFGDGFESADATAWSSSIP